MFVIIQFYYIYIYINFLKVVDTCSISDLVYFTHYFNKFGNEYAKANTPMLLVEFVELASIY